MALYDQKGINWYLAIGMLTRSTTVMVRTNEDVAPYVGFGRVITKMVNGQYQYKVEFIFKCKFSEPSQSDTTKGDGVEFGTTEMQGTVSALGNGKWSQTATFTSKATAVTYLETLLGGTSA